MTPYNMDMSEEKAPKQRTLLAEGDRLMTIVSCEEKKSKAGNMMFVIGFKDDDTGHVTDVYAVAEKGKRWFLKSVLEACGADFANWDTPEVLDKKLLCTVVHEENDWVNREGENVKSKQHKISNVVAIAWDE